MLSASWLVLRTLNHLARLDLRRLQALLVSDSLASYFNYVYSILLRVLSAKLSSSETHATAAGGDRGAAGEGGGGGGGSGGGEGKAQQTNRWEIEGCLEQLLILLGYYFLENEATQQCLSTSPILLNRLTDLPFRYFYDETYKDVLFPTLLSLCYPSQWNKGLLLNEMNTELLVTYLEERCIQQQVEAEREKEEKEKGKEKEKEKEPLPASVLLSLRFPPIKWRDAAAFFRS